MTSVSPMLSPPAPTRRSPFTSSGSSGLRWLRLGQLQHEARVVPVDPRAVVFGPPTDLCLLVGVLRSGDHHASHAPRTRPLGLLQLHGLDVPADLDRKSVVSGKSVSVRVDIGGRRIIKKKKNHRSKEKRK